MSCLTCFFDFDGTLSDSAPGILRSVRYALEKMGIEPPPADRLRGFLGPPLPWAFSHYFGLSEEEGWQATRLYRECYTAGAMFDCNLYDGIPELLRRLRDERIPCVVTTCKPTVTTEKIIAHYGIGDLFAFVSGPELDGTRGEKDEVIRYALEQLHITDPSRVRMIGDRAGDASGAVKEGVPCYGVLWGYGTKEELFEAGAKTCFRTPAELLEQLLKDNQTRKDVE